MRLEGAVRGQLQWITCNVSFFCVCVCVCTCVQSQEIKVVLCCPDTNPHAMHTRAQAHKDRFHIHPNQRSVTAGLASLLLAHKPSHSAYTDTGTHTKFHFSFHMYLNKKSCDCRACYTAACTQTLTQCIHGHMHTNKVSFQMYLNKTSVTAGLASLLLAYNTHTVHTQTPAHKQEQICIHPYQRSVTARLGAGSARLPGH